MTRTEKIAVRLLEPINPSFIIILGIYMVVWGLWVLCPWWDVFGVSTAFATMASISTEYFWGTLSILVGLIVCRGALKPSAKNVRLGALVAFFHWLLLSVLYFMGDWHATGGLTAATFCIYSCLVWVNVKVNHKVFK